MKYCDEKWIGKRYGPLEVIGLNYHTIYNRIWMGWSEEDAINTPIVGLGANQTTYK